MFEMDLAQIHLQLFGEEHRQGGVGALPHLDLVHDEGHAPLTVDADKGVGREGVRRGGPGGLGMTHQRGQAEAQ